MKRFLGLVLVVFSLSACAPTTEALVESVQECIFDILAKGTNNEVFNSCIKKAGVKLTDIVIDELTKELLGFSDDALGKVTNTVLGPAIAVPAPGVATPVGKEQIVNMLVKEIKTISEK